MQCSSHPTHPLLTPHALGHHLHSLTPSFSTASLPPFSLPNCQQVLPKREGLLHVSEWDFGHMKSIGDVVKEGDTVDVMITELQVSTVQDRGWGGGGAGQRGRYGGCDDDYGAASECISR